MRRMAELTYDGPAVAMSRYYRIGKFNIRAAKDAIGKARRNPLLESDSPYAILQAYKLHFQSPDGVHDLVTFTFQPVRADAGLTDSTFDDVLAGSLPAPRD